MAYTDQTSWRANPAAATAVVAIHAAAGFALIAGLSVTLSPAKTEPRPTATQIPLPPPPPDPVEKQKPDQPVPKQQTPPIYVPPSPIPPIGKNRDTGTTTILPDPGPIIRDPGLTGPKLAPLPPSNPPTPPGLDPVSAQPRNAPGGWLRPNDYRSSWIRRELTGTVAFTLRVGADGRVDSCRLNGSTGHKELDGATCRLIERRARFEPARDRTGNAVPGNYSSSVRWQLPQ